MSLLIWASWGCALGLAVLAEAIPCRIHGNRDLPVAGVFPAWVSVHLSPPALWSPGMQSCASEGLSQGILAFSWDLPPESHSCDVQVMSGSLRTQAISAQPLLLTGTSPLIAQKNWFCTWLSCCAHVESSQHHFMCRVWGDGSTLEPGKRWHWVMPYNESDCQKFVILIVIIF